MTRFYADLNPAYPSTGEHRWRVFRRDGLTVQAVGKSYRCRRSAETAATRFYVAFAMINLGLVRGEVEQ
jgi:hypothetical protein